VIVAAAVLAGGAPARAALPVGVGVVCKGADALSPTASVTATRAAIACLVDAARAQRDLPALKRDTRLQTAAQRFARALDPARPLSHAGRGGSTPLSRIQATGYARATGAFTASETLGRSRGSLSTPAVRVTAWLAARATRKLLLSARYRDVGIGVATVGGVTTYVVELAKPLPATSSSSKTTR
jgi:uncharacterized protein YkwD